MLEVLGGFAVAGVIAMATWRIASGIATIGDFMAFITALVLAAQPTRGLGNLSVRVQEGLAAAERFYALLDEKPEIVDRPDAKPLAVSKGAIAFEGVTFSYATSKGTQAVRDLTLSVPGGKTVALVGRSGAGKSTIINLVPRLFDVQSGRITIDGTDIRDATIGSLRGAIAMVSQDVTLFDDSIRANIALGRLDAPEADIIAAAKAAAAHDFILEQPQGYDTVIGDRGSRLSGGQRQRLALARAILKDAPILLLDEATSALDSESERLVQAALARFTKGRTTLVIAHRLSTVENADIICVMEVGQIVDFVKKLHDRSALERREAKRLFLAGQGFVAWPGPALRKFVDEIVVANRMASGGFVIDGHTVTLADIHCPVLYFFGDRDTMGRPAAVRGIRRAAPAIEELYEIKVSAGHFGLVVGSSALTVTWPSVTEWRMWKRSVSGGTSPSVSSPAWSVIFTFGY